MTVTTKIQMDLALRGAPPTVHAVQDDKYSRNLEITLYANGAAWSPPDGALAAVRYNKPDGTGGSYDTLPDGTAACSIAGNVLTVALAPQVCTAAGTVILAVALSYGSVEISTFCIKISVQANPERQIASEDYYRLTGYVPVSGWEPGKFLATDATGVIVAVDAPAGGGAVMVTVEEVLAAMPSVTAIDFTNFLNGSYTETIDGVVTERSVTFTENGMIVDGITVTFPAEAEATA